MDAGQTAVSFVKLLVADADRAARFYEALGFERLRAEPPFIHLRWRGQAEVYLVAVPAGLGVQGPRGQGVLLGFRADDGGVEAVASRAREAGALVDGPVSQPWHTREVIVTDPEGYRLNFIERA